MISLQINRGYYKAFAVRTWAYADLKKYIVSRNSFGLVWAYLPLGLWPHMETKAADITYWEAG